MEAEFEVLSVDKIDIQQVNDKMMIKISQMIDDADDVETVVNLTKAIANLNTSLRNNQVFAPKESEEEANKRRTRAAAADILKG